MATESRAWPNLVSLQAGQGVALILSALSVAVVSRVLGPDKYGRLTLFLTLAQYVVILTVNWTSAAVIRFGRDEYLRDASIHRVFWTRTALVLPCLAVAAVVLAAAQQPIAAWTGLPRDDLLLLFAMILALAAADHVDGSLQAAGLWRRYAWLAVVEKSVFLAGLALVAALVSEVPVRVALALAVAAQATRVLAGGIAVLRSGLVRHAVIDAGVQRAILAYSWPQIFTFTIGYFSAFAEPFLIRKYLTLEAVGVYQVPFQVSLFSIALLTPMATLMFPAVTSLRFRNREDLLVMLLGRIVPQFVFVMNIALVLAMALATVLFRPVFGEAYAAGLTPLLILMAAVSFQTVSTLYGPVLAAYDLTKQSAALNTVGGIFAHLVPEILLIAAWGISGAAASWLIWYACSATVSVWVIARRIQGATYSALLYPGIALAGLLIVTTAPTALARWLSTAALIGAAVGWARFHGLFRVRDMELLDTLGIPLPIRRGARRAYALLEGASAESA